MAEWPALMVGPDMLHQASNLNGRRWSGSALLNAWGKQRRNDVLHLASSDSSILEQINPVLDGCGHQAPRQLHGLLHPDPFATIGGLFLPDPSIGRWSRFRERIGAHRFSLIGQIHTLSTPAAQQMLEMMVSEPVQPWDALICSSEAGRRVVEALLHDREALLQRRFQSNSRPERPQLPVIPLPVPVAAIKAALPTQAEARAQLGLPQNAKVCLWLGRLSMATKLDPWTHYRLLSSAASQLESELWLVECGPDDSAEQAAHLERLRGLCPGIRFLRLGGQQAVSETVKWQALAAADVAVSLVDNCQETFGLSLVEAMAAGLPVLASDWDGYRDLVRHGLDGFLVPSRWLPGAQGASQGLAWAQELGLASFPFVAGALAQLVALDVEAACAMLLCLLENPTLARRMGCQGQKQMGERCEADVVMGRYEELFEELKARRCAHGDFCSNQPLLSQDPVRLFEGFASSGEDAAPQPASSPPLSALHPLLKDLREPLWSLALQACSTDQDREKLRSVLAQKHL